MRCVGGRGVVCIVCVCEVCGGERGCVHCVCVGGGRGVVCIVCVCEACVGGEGLCALCVYVRCVWGGERGCMYCVCM